MKVLIACEFSGIVRDAFIAAGHSAISCDLLPMAGPFEDLDVANAEADRYRETERLDWDDDQAANQMELF